MNKITYLVISVFISAVAVSCNDSSSSSTETGYVDPVFTTVKTQAVKSYNVAGQSCAGSKSCGAVIFTGTLSDKNYTGMAIDNYLSGGSKFSLKIYWEAASIPASIDNPSGFVIKVIAGTSTYSTVTSGSLKADITQGTDANGVSIYTITFTDTLTLDSAFTINTGDTIVAYKYPE